MYEKSAPVKIYVSATDAESDSSVVVRSKNFDCSIRPAKDIGPLYNSLIADQRIGF
jgi:hypothetical protein